ncbi:hypothetical protein FNU76_01965 [Chitinimonas arctica]|uniref:Cyclic di-GMP receptor atypical PilZ domain-containing protein n=1 Tax=Chitinimonas arctica TaxID=2594795 RepID=A0A516SAN4_9NEIS|nr:PilZ domain-containing protein [Chitinimonas arctica]QDQ25214.1 hypothetical protein FNU76_01965 [Chitinimonas arctica]
MAAALSIDLDLPLAWLHAAPPPGTDGVLLLRVLALLEAAPPHLDDEDGPEALRWQALEARVDLTLQLLGQLLARGEPLPPTRPLVLHGGGASWLAATALPVGDVGTLVLHLSPRIPQPLYLSAHIDSCLAEAGGWRVNCSFQHLDAELQDWLEKTIFRRHRREIFERKHPHDD